MLAIAALVVTLATVPDQWPMYKPTHSSPNGKYRLNVTWVPRKNPIFTFQANGKQIWKKVSPQKAPPYRVFITDDGQRVVLLEEWAGLGYGVSLAILGSKGETLRADKLEQLIPPTEFRGAMRTTSSIWWLSGSEYFLTPGEKEFFLLTGKGTKLCFDLESGKKIEPSPANVSTWLAPRIQEARNALAKGDLNGAPTRLATMGDKASAPTLEKLLNEGSRKNKTDLNSQYRLLSVGQALVTLTGVRSVPSLVAARSRSTERTRPLWQQLIDSAKHPETSH